MTSDESFLTNAPMTPRDVRRRYSNGLDFEVVLRNGYRNRGICAILCQRIRIENWEESLPCKNKARVSL